MKISIDKIKVLSRIRKEVNNINELAANIREHGLITPIAVMPLDGGEFQLLAGLRRLRAMELNGESQIDAKVFPASDAEAALKIEYSENEQRMSFTFSEKADYARLVEEIERVKAHEKQVESGVAYGRGHQKKVEDCGSQPISGRQPQTRDIVGAKIGISGKQYDRMKFITANAPQEIIDELDRDERTIRGTYDELRAKDKSAELAPVSLPQRSVPEETIKVDFTLKTDVQEESEPLYEAKPHGAATPVPQHPQPQPTKRTKKIDPLLEKLQAEEAEHIRKIREFEALTPDEKISELQQQLKTERIRANIAESELAREKELHLNDVYHRDGTIENQKMRINTLLARIAELEEKYEPDKHTV